MHSVFMVSVADIEQRFVQKTRQYMILQVLILLYIELLAACHNHITMITVAVLAK